MSVWQSAAMGAIAVAVAVGPSAHHTPVPVTAPMEGDSHPAVDSAAAARNAAREAARASNAATRVAWLRRAVYAWPTQPAYWEMLLRAAVDAADSSAQHDARAALTALDVGAGPVRPHGARVVHVLADSLAFVEGMARDAATQSVWVTEMRRGTLLRVREHVVDVRLDTVVGMSAVWAAHLVRGGHELLVTSAPAPVYSARGGVPAVAALWTVEAATGAVTARQVLPDSAAAHAPGAVMQMRDGTIVVSDAGTAALYVRAPGAASFTAIRHALLRSPQGVVEVADGVLVVADYSHGLLRVRPASGAVDRLDDAPGATVLGLDGLVWHAGRVWAVQNGLSVPRLVCIQLDGRYERVLRVETVWRDSSMLASPTALAADDAGLWLFTNTQWDDYAEQGQRRPTRPLTAAGIAHMPWPEALQKE